MKWKTLAIILLIIVILETSLIIWAVNTGNEMIENELVCGLEVCSDAQAYFFDDYTNVCECYTNNELVKTEVIR